jgi:uncharacterized membrane protein
MAEISSAESEGARVPEPRSLSRWQSASARLRLSLVGLGGLLVALASSFATDRSTSALIGWVLAAALFLGWTWGSIWPMNSQDTARLATREDPSRTISDLVILAASVGSLFAVAIVIFHAHQAGPTATVLGVAAVFVSWALVHSVFTLKYTRLYYAPPIGGVDFNMDPDPAYRDFAYVAFIVGMTYQVADTDIQNSLIRSTILRHALISYVFGAIVIAITINLVAGLSH